MVSLGEPIEDVTAPEALLYLLRVTSGHVAWLHTELAHVEDLSTREGEVIASRYDSERDRLTRISEACVKAGIAEALVKVEEAKTVAMVQAMHDVLGELRLTRGQRKALGPALRRHAQKLMGAEPAPDTDEQIAAALALDGPPVEWIE